MATLTMNKPRKFQGEPQYIVEHNMAGNLRIFAGAACIEAADGNAGLAVAGAGAFLGFATEEMDNRSGSVYGGLGGQTPISIQMQGLVWLPVLHSGTWIRGDTGVTVYASDDDTFTITAGTNPAIGKVVFVPPASVVAGTAEVLVFFQADQLRSL